MKGIGLYNDFCFINMTFARYRYSDNRGGSPYNYLAYMVKGEGKIVTKDKTVFIKEGDVFYIPKGLSYQSYWNNDGDVNFLSFGYKSLNIRERTKYQVQIVNCADKLIERIKNIPTKGTDIDCDTLSCFYDVMAEVIPLLEVAARNNDEVILERIKAHIKNNPHATMTEVARLSAVSESYLYYLFKKVADTTPNDYKQKVLCRMGIELLLTTDKKIEEICNIINFSSSSYFRKVLKKHTGMSPREIRKQSGF